MEGEYNLPYGLIYKVIDYQGNKIGMLGVEKGKSKGFIRLKNIDKRTFEKTLEDLLEAYKIGEKRKGKILDNKDKIYERLREVIDEEI